MGEKAAILTAEFNKKKAMEDMAIQSYSLQKKWYDQEMKLAADYESVRQKGLKSNIATPGLTATPAVAAAPMMTTAAAPVTYAAPAAYAAPATYAAPTTAYAA